MGSDGDGADMGFWARVAGLAAVIAADICLAGVLAAVAEGGHAENVIPEGPPSAFDSSGLVRR